MDSRRQHHSTSSSGGGRGAFNSSRRGRGGGGGGRGGGGRGGSFQTNRGSYWFKGEGYNDQEAVSIDEEVVGISGFLAPPTQQQPGFSGLVKQRFSDFIVHEIAKNGQQVVLASLAKKKKHVSHQFQDLVAGFAYGESSISTNYNSNYNSSGSPANANDEQPAALGECLQVLRDMGEQLGKQSYALVLQGRKALECQNACKLVELVTAELGKKMGKDFSDFIDKVKLVQLQEEERLAAQQGAASVNNSNSDSVTIKPEPVVAIAPELVFYIGGLNEKRERVFLHETMRRYGKALIVADTITSDDQSQVIRVRRAFAPGQAKRGERDPRKEWPVEQPEYLQFVLYRRNKDISAVVNQMASVLKVSPSIFSVADPKDKRGVATQLCTAHRLTIEKLQSLQKFNTSKALEEYQFLVGGRVKYVPNKLSPGDCLGNKYSIVIRALAETDLVTPESLDKTVASWLQRGFVNYFGLQRFGNSATPFHLIGRAVLRKDFKLAVLLLLRPQDGEASKVREAREHFRQHKDVSAALRMLPPFLIAERTVLEGLLQNGIDANELAFRNVPLNHRVAYVEAYQNYVWNEMASLRIGSLSVERPVVGDLVLVKNSSGDNDENAGPAKKKVKTEAGVSVPVSVPAGDGKVLVLTEANVHEYSIDDVVLPLPGHSIVYPANEIGAAYQKMLMTDGVDLGSWLGVQQQQYQLEGTYRHVIKKPFDVSAQVKEYENAIKPLLLTDVDHLVLQARQQGSGDLAEVVKPNKPKVSVSVADAPSVPAVPAGKKPVQRALVLHFGLEYGSDATIAVRELMKQSSSMHVQWQLSDQHASGGKAKDKDNSSGAKKAEPKKTTGASGSAAVGVGNNRRAEKKIIAQKKTQVSIGRPGFSLGKY